MKNEEVYDPERGRTISKIAQSLHRYIATSLHRPINKPVLFADTKQFMMVCCLHLIIDMSLNILYLVIPNSLVAGHAKKLN